MPSLNLKITNILQSEAKCTGFSHFKQTCLLLKGFPEGFLKAKGATTVLCDEDAKMQIAKLMKNN